ncbi:MAG TPA: GH3 auxin-responsive promoter family protein, partial [Archangium sp.]
MKVTALNLAWAVSRRPAVRRFARAIAEPEAAQLAWLKRFLSDNAGTAYGRAHGYSRIGSVRQFRERVPVVGWEELAPWVERLERGER